MPSSTWTWNSLKHDTCFVSSFQNVFDILTKSFPRTPNPQNCKPKNPRGPRGNTSCKDAQLLRLPCLFAMDHTSKLVWLYALTHRPDSGKTIPVIFQSIIVDKYKTVFHYLCLLADVFPIIDCVKNISLVIEVSNSTCKSWTSFVYFQKLILTKCTRYKCKSINFFKYIHKKSLLEFRLH